MSREPWLSIRKGAGKGRLVNHPQSESSFAHRTGDLDRGAEKEDLLWLPCNQITHKCFRSIACPKGPGLGELGVF